MCRLFVETLSEPLALLYTTKYREKMVEMGKELTRKLLDLIEKTGYAIIQHNGQRKFGPPPDWNGPPPAKGCEVFIGKLPREIFEDELVPLFSRVGKIYDMRLMMDFSGSNRGYAFVTYTNRADAAAAVRQLDQYEIRPGRYIGVVKSVDNCRLFVGGIPKNKTKEQIAEELARHVAGIVDVILYKNCFDRRLNRGFAFVEFTSHRAAAMARRSLVPGFAKLWDQDVMVDWAEPEPHVDDEQMRKVKVLYVRNLMVQTTPNTIQQVFEAAINQKIERIKKIYDYAFIHFYERSHAEQAMTKLQNAAVDGANIEISWAKPVDRDLYRIQKLNKGNAKFNNVLDWSQTLMLYKNHLEKREYNHLEKREYANSLKEDEGISSGCAGESPRDSPSDIKPWESSYAETDYTLAPAKLESICRRNMWALPVYEYQKMLSAHGGEAWVCRVELPHVGVPLLSSPRRLGPLATQPCLTRHTAHIEAAEHALHCIKLLRADLIQRSLPPPALYLPPPGYPAPLTYEYPLPMRTSLPYDMTSLYSRAHTPLPQMQMWRTA